MCWQDISLKDSTSQELLEAVQRERRFAATPSRNAAVFRQPTLGAFELQHLPVGASTPDLEERIIQHLAAAAAMGRSHTHHTGTNKGQRSRPSAHGRPHFLVFSTNPDSARPAAASSPLTLTEEESEPDGIIVANPSNSRSSGANESSRPISKFPSRQNSYSSSCASGSSVRSLHRWRSSLNNRRRCTSSISCMSNHEKARPSEFQSISESLKSRFNAVSTRYKETISKSTRVWKERLFSRTSSMSALGSDVHREINAGISSVSRPMQQLENKGNNSAREASVLGESSVTGENNHKMQKTHE